MYVTKFHHTDRGTDEEPSILFMCGEKKPIRGRWTEYELKESDGQIEGLWGGVGGRWFGVALPVPVF